MLYSFEKQRGMKEYIYYRYSFRKDYVFEEIIYCKNDTAFLKFLDDMNSRERNNKFHSRKDWNHLKEAHELLISKNISKDQKSWLENES